MKQVITLYIIVLAVLFAGISCESAAPNMQDDGTFDLAYKSDMEVESQEIFSIGDVDNSYLFRVDGLVVAPKESDPTSPEGIDGLKADIVITEKGKTTALYSADNLAANYFIDPETEKFVIGFGPSADEPVDFQLVQEKDITITIVVKQDDTVYFKKSLDRRGTAEGAIFTWRDLQNMRNNLDGVYELQNDFKFPEKNTYGFSGFEPIGRAADTSNSQDFPTEGKFSGSIDGLGYKISQLVIENDNTDYAGLFCYVSGSARIEGVIIDHSGIEGGDYVGALAGYASSGAQITNVGMESSIQSVIHGNMNVGGLVGFAEEGVVITGYANSAVEGQQNIGGLVGSSRAALTGYATGSVTGSMHIGGLVGYAGENSEINGYAKGIVSGSQAVGGLIGKENNVISITGYARGNVVQTSGTELSLGRLIGVTASSVVQGYHSASESKLQVLNVVGEHGTEMYVEENTVKSDFSLFEFDAMDSVWVWVRDGAWPAITIGDVKSADVQPIAPAGELELIGCRTVENKPTLVNEKYEIRTVEELQWISNCLDADYVLKSNIIIPDTMVFQPLGDLTNAFTGSFVGTGFYISNLILRKSSEEYVGLFRKIQDAEVQNVTISYKEISGRNYVGTLAGSAKNSTLSNIAIRRVANTNEIRGKQWIGGVVGEVINSTVTGSTDVSIIAQGSGGGMVGTAKANSLVIGYSSGSMNITSSPGGLNGVVIGGLVGRLEDSWLRGYNLASVQGYSSIGGLAGAAFGSSEVLGYSTPEALIYANLYGGGLIGELGNGSTARGFMLGTITRTSGTSNLFGLLIGGGSGSAEGYYSQKADESLIVDSGGTEISNVTGTNGTAVLIDTVDSSTYKNTFSSLTFDTEGGKWQWKVDGEWPKIDIGDVQDGGQNF